MSFDEWLAHKSASDLETIEFEGRLMYPDTLKRRGRKDAVIEEPVLFCPANTAELTAATREARNLIAKDEKRPTLTVEEAKALVGPTRWEEIENVHVLSKVLRYVEPPHKPRWGAEFLATAFPRAALTEAWDRLEFYTQRDELRLDGLSEEDFVVMVNAIARVKHTGPLVVIDGSARESFVSSMAVRLQSFLTSSSSSPSGETSTPEA